MALRGCVGSRAHEAALQAIEEAVKDNSITRLSSLLNDSPVGPSGLNRRHLLHQAAWLGHHECVRLLLEQGANPDKCHRKNGCTPLHLAHFCTIDETDPSKTIGELVRAGASVNNPGSHKCGHYPMDHAVQHQRLDSVQALLSRGAEVPLRCLILTIDVTNPQILELLLLHGGEAGKLLDTVLFWGQPLHRVLYTPLKWPKECYKQMFRLVSQATICKPVHGVNTDFDQEPSKKASNHHLLVENELKSLAKDYVDLTRYLYAFLLRNGFYPTASIRTFMRELGGLAWVDDYLGSPPTLSDVAVRVIRSYSCSRGNIMWAVTKMSLPSRLKNTILMINPQ